MATTLIGTIPILALVGAGMIIWGGGMLLYRRALHRGDFAIGIRAIAVPLVAYWIAPRPVAQVTEIASVGIYGSYVLWRRGFW